MNMCFHKEIFYKMDSTTNFKHNENNYRYFTNYDNLEIVILNSMIILT